MDEPREEPETDGVLPSQEIVNLIKNKGIFGDAHKGEWFESSFVQPASFDLSWFFPSDVWEVDASFMPGPARTVEQALIAGECLRSSPSFFTLQPGRVYIVKLMNRMMLPPDISAATSPKSTAGRLDIFTRTITDYGVEFDRIPAGYNGPLYAEIVSQSFRVFIRSGSSCLHQIRFRRGEQPAKGAYYQPLSVDLTGDVVGWRAKESIAELDYAVKKEGDLYDPSCFFDRIGRPRSAPFVIEPGHFYLFRSLESVDVPRHYAGEMEPYNCQLGEFRAHYAGFFDPGFGNGFENKSRAVLEIRPRDVPMRLEHGQPVARIRFDSLTEKAGIGYGLAIGSSYQRQGLRLARQFR